MAMVKNVPVRANSGGSQMKKGTAVLLVGLAVSSVTLWIVSYEYRNRVDTIEIIVPKGFSGVVSIGIRKGPNECKNFGSSVVVMLDELGEAEVHECIYDGWRVVKVFDTEGFEYQPVSSSYGKVYRIESTPQNLNPLEMQTKVFHELSTLYREGQWAHRYYMGSLKRTKDYLKAKGLLAGGLNGSP